jgi:acyl-CoA hydrolase
MRPNILPDLTTLTDLVLPSETNPLNNLFLVVVISARMDRCASIAADILEE